MKLKNVFQKRSWWVLALLLGFATTFVGCSDDDDDGDGNPIEEPTGTISVTDQYYAEGGMFVIDAVSLTDAGWVVIHRDNGGAPQVPDIISDPVFLEAGTHSDVEVMLAEGEEVAAGETLWAMLHLDNGQEMVYEFNGGETDPPLMDSNGGIVMMSFTNDYTLGSESVSYPLMSVDGSGISGMVSFNSASRGNGGYVTIEVDGTPADGSHPAHIHTGTTEVGGPIAISLENVNGETGMSTTFVSADDAGNAVTYEDLLAYDGYVNVHLSENDLGTVVATGNIGANGATITDESTTYPLDNIAFTVNDGADTIQGDATLYRLSDGSSWLEIMLENTPEGGMHPAHIHENTGAEGGGIVITLDTVNGATGISRTHISEDNAGMAITYEDLLDYNGYINVHLSADDLATVVAQGDIGQNAFTGEESSYEFITVNDSGVTGTATIKERNNGEALVILAMEGTVDGAMHPAHIHSGSIDNPGSIAIDLTSVDGTTGMSMTNVSMFNDGTAVTYADLLTYDGYINVHLDAVTLTVVASANIGANAE